MLHIVTEYGGRYVSKLHHTIAKLERILFMPFLLFWGMHFSFGYTLFIWVWNFFWVCNFWGVDLCPFNLGVHILFGCALFIWVCTFYLGMHFLFGYALFIWVRTFHLGATVKCACAYMHPVRQRHAIAL